MSVIDQTTYEPVLCSRAVPKTGGALGVSAQPCLSFIRSLAHHAQPFQRMQNMLDFQRSRTCLISMTFEMHVNTLKNKNVFKHTNVRFAELCQENNESFNLQLLEVNSRDRQYTHLHCQLAVIFYSTFFFFFFKQSGFNSGHLINQTQTICCSPVSCWSALPEVRDMFQGCSLTLSLSLSAVFLQICSFHQTYSDWALFTAMTTYDSHSARQFVSKYRTCAKASYTTNC